jgi:thiamine-phosphate diphosphorylase
MRMSLLPRRPLLCLVTDRRRLRRAAPQGGAGDVELVLTQVRAAAGAGIDLVQIRERDLPGSVLVDLVREAVRITRGTQTRLLVNDRLDVALVCGADGVHLRSDSFAAPRAREISPAPFVIGRSVHDAVEAAAAAASGGLDYLIVGTIYPSASKAGAPVIGVSPLAAAARVVTMPVLGIGGITIDRLPEVAGSGAAGLAAIGLFSDPPADSPAGLAETVGELRRRWAAVLDVRLPESGPPEP